MTMLDKDFYSPKEVARVLGRHTNKIYQWLRSGSLEGLQPDGPGHGWLISREAIKRFQERVSV